MDSQGKKVAPQRRERRIYCDPCTREGHLGGFLLLIPCGPEEEERKGHFGVAVTLFLATGPVYPFLFFSFKRHEEKKFPPPHGRNMFAVETLSWQGWGTGAGARLVRTSCSGCWALRGL